MFTDCIGRKRHPNRTAAKKDMSIIGNGVCFSETCFLSINMQVLMQVNMQVWITLAVS